MDRAAYFNQVRGPLFRGRIDFGQTLGIEAKLDEFEKRKLTDLRWLAYMLATSYHETGKRMRPVREGFAISDSSARRIVAERAYGKRNPGPGKSITAGAKSSSPGKKIMRRWADCSIFRLPRTRTWRSRPMYRPRSCSTA